MVLPPCPLALSAHPQHAWIGCHTRNIEWVGMFPPKCPGLSHTACCWEGKSLRQHLSSQPRNKNMVDYTLPWLYAPQHARGRVPHNGGINGIFHVPTKQSWEHTLNMLFGWECTWQRIGMRCKRHHAKLLPHSHYCLLLLLVGNPHIISRRVSRKPR